MLIRPIKVEDAHAFLNLCNEIDESGWMFYMNQKKEKQR